MEDESIDELASESELREAYPIVDQLRPVGEETFLELVAEMRDESGYRLYGLRDEDDSLVAVTGFMEQTNLYSAPTSGFMTWSSMNPPAGMDTDRNYSPGYSNGRKNETVPASSWHLVSGVTKLTGFTKISTWRSIVTPSRRASVLKPPTNRGLWHVRATGTSPQLTCLHRIRETTFDDLR